LEVNVTNDLKKRGIGFTYEQETLIYIEPQQTRKYTPDVFLSNGVIIEIKGRWTAQDRKKMGLVLEQNPELDIRMLFQRDHKISKNSKTRYSNWCDKRGITYAIGNTVPEEWTS
jgi:hypothetical protein